MKNQTILLLFVIIISIGCRATDTGIDTTLVYAECQASIDSIYSANPKSVGIMVHVESPKNNLSWSGCSGYSNKDQSIKLACDQPALIASSIKPYVATTILRLQEQNKLTIEDPIGIHLTEKTAKLFQTDGYDLDAIRVKHLLSHTSGIYNYANGAYLDMIQNNKLHRWTRDEQLNLSIEMGSPLGSPADTFVYADANYLLATEIIETVSDLPFYSAMRKLLKYEELGLEDTWFPTLEKPNPTTKKLVHQYWSSREWDSYDIDPSFDLYGGGGIASTTSDIAQFAYSLFQGKIIEDTTIFNKIFTQIIPSNGEDMGYYLGLGEGTSNGLTYYGHGGFWGTTVLYFPELEASIAVYILDRDQFHLRKQVTNAVVKQIANHLERDGK